jgi:hypothetical protein
MTSLAATASAPLRFYVRADNSDPQMIDLRMTVMQSGGTEKSPAEPGLVFSTA